VDVIERSETIIVLGSESRAVGIHEAGGGLVATLTQGEITRAVVSVLPDGTAVVSVCDAEGVPEFGIGMIDGAPVLYRRNEQGELAPVSRAAESAADDYHTLN